MTDPFGRYRLSQNILRNRQREAERETVRLFKTGQLFYDEVSEWVALDKLKQIKGDGEQVIIGYDFYDPKTRH